MSGEGVVAVIRGPLGFPLAVQDGVVDAVLTGNDALAKAIASDSEWLWLLEPGVRPDSGALGELLRAVKPTGDPIASLVAGMVLDGSGRPIEDLLPAHEYTDTAAILRLVEQRLLPIRHAPFANCLIRRSCFVSYGVPDFTRFGRYAPRAWTASLVGREPGYFAPLSVAVLVGAPRRASLGDALATSHLALHMTRSGASTKGESARTLMRLVGQLTRSPSR